ncbi:MAG: hypothetical protein CMH76_06280 [Nitrospinae bacterium]|jgi:uncharacterized protein (TIGR01244 family)|nr:hypothetical protein [Nitrospinota bacterium]|tara:strand:- start:131 stop:418 length:288 start_codon:yes stop_codon:yes gene_type:complete
MDYKQASDDIFFGGQPTPEDLRGMAERGVKTVINLRLPGEDQPELPIDRAAAEAEKLGMKYVHIPAGLKNFTDKLLADVGKAIQEGKADGSVFVH